MRRLPGLRSRRAVGLAMIAVLVLAGGLRAARAANPDPQQSPDARAYAELARELAHGQVYGHGLTQAFHWPPGAPALFAVAYRASGAGGRVLSSAAPYWAQAVVGTGTVAAVLGLTTLLAGPASGLLAGLLVAVYPPLVRTTGELLSEPLGACLLAAAMLALAWALRRGGPRWLAASGALFGLAVLTRADLLLAPFLVAGLVGVSLWRRHGAATGLSRAALMGGATLAVLAPWTAYASVRQGHLVPVTEGDGPALFVGTFLPGDGTTEGLKRVLGPATRRRVPRLRGVPSSRLTAEAVLNTVAARHPGEDREAALRTEALRNLRHDLVHPFASARMVAGKLGRMWWRSSRAGSPVASGWTRAFHRVLVVLALIAVAAGLAVRRDLLLGAMVLVVAYSTAVHAVFVAKPRYNLPLMPLVIAAGVTGAVVAVRDREAVRARLVALGARLRRRRAPSSP